MTADEVVLAFVGFPGTVRPRAAKSLKAFTRVTLAPGETRVVRMAIPLDDLRYRDPATHGWKLESGVHRIVVARSATEELMAVDVPL
jgi:beta-glucosidase